MAKLEKGTVFPAKEVIDYADGGVVSKELVHNNAGSVTLFSFDAGQGLSEHSAPFYALIQVIDGKMELTVRIQSMSSVLANCLLSLLEHAILSMHQNVSR